MSDLSNGRPDKNPIINVKYDVSSVAAGHVTRIS